MQETAKNLDKKICLDKVIHNKEGSVNSNRSIIYIQNKRARAHCTADSARIFQKVYSGITKKVE